MKKYWIVFACVALGVCLGVYWGMSKSTVSVVNPGEGDVVYTDSSPESTSIYIGLPAGQDEENSTGEPSGEETTVLLEYTIREPETEVPTAPAGEMNAGAQPTLPPEEIETTTEAYTISRPSDEVTAASLIDKTELAVVERVLLTFGFEYNKEQNIFYSSLDPWQKNMGFNEIYDALAPFGAMVYQTERFKFNYDGKDWMFQIWKGRYGILSGAEMGIYAKDPSRSAEFYNGVDQEDFICMEFKLYKDGKLYMFQGPARHWWVTGFKFGDIVYGDEFLMEVTYYLDDAGMADALEGAVAAAGFEKGLLVSRGYFRDGNSIRIFW